MTHERSQKNNDGRAKNDHDENFANSLIAIAGILIVSVALSSESVSRPSLTAESLRKISKATKHCHGRLKFGLPLSGQNNDDNRLPRSGKPQTPSLPPPSLTSRPTQIITWATRKYHSHLCERISSNVRFNKGHEMMRSNQVCAVTFASRILAVGGVMSSFYDKFSTKSCTVQSGAPMTASSSAETKTATRFERKKDVTVKQATPV
jgi:hypothetical protein